MFASATRASAGRRTRFGADNPRPASHASPAAGRAARLGSQGLHARGRRACECACGGPRPKRRAARRGLPRPAAANAATPSAAALDADLASALQLDQAASLADLLAALSPEATQLLLLPTWRAAAAALLGEPPGAEPWQQQNRFRPALAGAIGGFLAGSISLLSEMEFGDFLLLLRLCTAAGHAPSKEWLASVIYADTGGFERFYQQADPRDLVVLFSDLSLAMCSHRHLTACLARAVTRRQQQAEEAAPDVAALTAALDTSLHNLRAVRADGLLAGELHAMCGYWMLSRLLPEVDAQHVLLGLRAMEGLGYKVLDSSDADKLVQLMAAQAREWQPDQLAEALQAAASCLQVAPSDGAPLAVVFASAAENAERMSSRDAAAALVAVAGLPVYRPDDACVKALLRQVLASPDQLSKRLLYTALKSAEGLGVAPDAGQLQVVAGVLA